jgi:hypothetical protein
MRGYAGGDPLTRNGAQRNIQLQLLPFRVARRRRFRHPAVGDDFERLGRADGRRGPGAEEILAANMSGRPAVRRNIVSTRFSKTAAKFSTID